ncbi:hypothetical protein HpBGD133_16300 [Helicobacter pylori]
MLKNPPSHFPKIKEIIGIDGVRVVFEHGFGAVSFKHLSLPTDLHV